ncbi:SRPBCC family protein [Thalassiella azotivora]
MSTVPVVRSSIEIAAPPARVWELVSDVRQMPRWSPTVASTRLRDGHERVELGTEFTNRNVDGELQWTTRGTVVRYEPERELAFRIADNWVVWVFRLEPCGEGTLLSEHRETPEGVSELSQQLTDRYMGGQEAFTERLRAGVEQTLQRIKAEAEA